MQNSHFVEVKSIEVVDSKNSKIVQLKQNIPKEIQRGSKVKLCEVEYSVDDIVNNKLILINQKSLTRSNVYWDFSVSKFKDRIFGVKYKTFLEYNYCHISRPILKSKPIKIPY